MGKITKYWAVSSGVQSAGCFFALHIRTTGEAGSIRYGLRSGNYGLSSELRNL